MRDLRALLQLLALLLALPPAPVSGQPLVLETVATGLTRPVGIVAPGDDTGRLFLVQLDGVIRILLEGGGVLAAPFLDLSSSVSCCSERGLLGLAFHPDYENNGFFIVHYTDVSGDSVVERYEVSSNPNVADALSGQLVLTQSQPASNHNGGQLAFGPDGNLYVALGDGGGGGDPFANGQDATTLLGAILRIDVDTLPYTSPPTNPFVGDPAGADEIWVWGLRNPWRFSFDRDTGDLFIGDVGQKDWEEIDLQSADSAGGENYGWNIAEGAHCYPPGSTCSMAGLTPPILEFDHPTGCSVTGGYRYRGHHNWTLRNAYVFSDYCAGTIWAAGPVAGEAWSAAIALQTGFQVTSFGEDERGELYVTEYANGTAGAGRVHRLLDTSSIFFDDFESGELSAWVPSP